MDDSIKLAYLVAATLFILGVRGLTHPRTAVRGNLLGAAGMLLAVVATLFDNQIVGYWTIGFGLLAGTLVGVALAVRIQMTAMPQLVALFNGFGGIASVLVAGASMFFGAEEGDPTTAGVGVATAASGLIGAVTFTGSMVAFAKLQELFSDIPIPAVLRHLATAGLGLVALLLTGWLIGSPDSVLAYALLVVVSLALGVLLVAGIGAADMPVAIALLNSYSGLAASATGFVVGSNVLIIAGSLVGASGVILTRIMCKAMNRSLGNVMFGVMGPTEETASADEVYAGRVKSTSAEEVAMLFDAASRVVIVPGYGMAVAQAQHAVRELTDLLTERGIEVEFGIHPVAGRMPGHMNVLLAEAEISYDKLLDMDQVNPTFGQTDVALVIGANDVVNPMARTDPSCPIGGMPILDVDKARTVVVIKRSLSPGFAGIPNPLFAADNTLMLFADGKQAVVDMTAALKET